MQELLTLLITWLVIAFGLPATDQYPTVEFIPTAEIEALRQSRWDALVAGGLLSESGVSTPARPSHEVYAFYDDRSRTIFLPERWAADSPYDVSMLVHELVHHLQNIGGLTYTCPEARERPAYQAQARWLGIFGSTLSEAFDIDAMTIHLRTHCFS